MNSPLSMEEILAGVKQEGHQKTASAASRGMTNEDLQYSEELALLDKVAQDMSQDELLKIAASAKLTGEIMSDIQLEKLSSELPARLMAKLAEPIRRLVAQAVVDTLQKVAVGESEVITGHTKEIDPDGNPQEAALLKDQVGKSEEPVGVRNMANAVRTEGAVTQGGGDPESNTGEQTMQNPEGGTVNKMSSAAAQLEQLLYRAGVSKQAMGGAMGGYGIGGMDDEMGGAMGGGMEDPQQLIQQLMAKQQAGIPLSPQEQELLQQIMMSGGMGGGMGAEGGVREAANTERVRGVTDFLRARLLQGS